MWRSMLTLVAILGLLGWTGRTVVAQEKSVTIYNAAGDEVATIAVTEVIDPFEDYDEFSPPAEGQRYVLVAVTIENTGDAPFDVQSYYVQLVDSRGRVTSVTYTLRTQESLDEHPDLVAGPIDPGASVSGAVLFAVPEDAELTQVIYWAYIEVQQFYLLADISGVGSQGSGAGDEEASPVAASPVAVEDEATAVAIREDDEAPEDTDDGDASGDSGDVEASEDECAWAEDTLDRLDTLQPVGEELQGMGSGDIDVDRVREIADDLTAAAEEQRDSDPSAALEEANEQIADALDIYADVLNAAADAVEADDESGIDAMAADIEEANGLIQAAGEATAPLLESCGV